MEKQNKIVDVRKIDQLRKCRFFIPAYQRGYRWTDKQVQDLLNDIAAFSPKPIEDSEEKTWYCLQPVVVKPRKDQGDFEVIDGQQRLTTIYLVLHYLNQGYRESRRKALYSICYATRPDSQQFLEEKLEEGKVVDTNIDFYFISRAYRTICQWFEEKEDGFDYNDFESKFYFHTKVIWYESEEKDAIKVFTRLNIGKIPLTNAELIKALFLNSSNFKGDTEKIKLKQLEIAGQWDRIEYSLQNPEFWYFINENENPVPTRIEFIFNLMAGENGGDDEYATFRYFSDKFSRKNKAEMMQNWEEVKLCFQTLEEWFTDRELYHKVGFLIAAGMKISKLLGLKEGLTKRVFRAQLDEQIGARVQCNLDTLEYKNSKLVRKVLLLHNIQTLLNDSSSFSRFPFDRYKQEKWDVEHISSVAELQPKTEKHQQDWLKEASEFIENKALRKEAKAFETGNFEDLFERVLEYFNESGRNEETNFISNLALLDRSTNRSYGNSVFPVKRRKIIEKDSSGTFVPLCTKNVFLKYFTKEVGQMTFWGEEDGKAYLNHIKFTLKKYL